MTGANASGALLEQLGVDLDPELLVLALTHRSFAHEAGGIPHNERLEFLGDSVLSLVVTEALYRRHPDLSEGELAKMRAATVAGRSLATVARKLGLGPYLLLGKGERVSGGADKDSLLADTVEALIGAVYFAHGLEVARALIHRLVDAQLEVAAGLGAALDWKTSLQEACAQLGFPPPEYHVTGSGPDHARFFTAQVIVGTTTTQDERRVELARTRPSPRKSLTSEARSTTGHGQGTSRKFAELEAAKDAFTQLQAALA